MPLPHMTVAAVSTGLVDATGQKVHLWLSVSLRKSPGRSCAHRLKNSWERLARGGCRSRDRSDHLDFLRSARCRFVSWASPYETEWQCDLACDGIRLKPIEGRLGGSIRQGSPIMSTIINLLYRIYFRAYLVRFRRLA